MPQLRYPWDEPGKLPVPGLDPWKVAGYDRPYGPEPPSLEDILGPNLPQYTATPDQQTGREQREVETGLKNAPFDTAGFNVLKGMEDAQFPGLASYRLQQSKAREQEELYKGTRSLALREAMGIPDPAQRFAALYNLVGIPGAQGAANRGAVGATSREYEAFFNDYMQKNPGATAAAGATYAQGKINDLRGQQAGLETVARFGGPAGEARAALTAEQERRRLGAGLGPSPTGDQSLFRAGATERSLGGAAAKIQESTSIMEGVEADIDKMSAVVDRLNLGKTWSEAMLNRGPMLKSGAFTGWDQQAALYDSMKNMFLGPIARKIMLEVGVLTEFDVQRARDALPTFFDTHQLAKAKLDGIRQVLQFNKQLNKLRLMSPDGVVPDEVRKQYRLRFDKTLDRLDSLTQAGQRGEPLPPEMLQDVTDYSSTGQRVR